MDLNLKATELRLGLPGTVDEPSRNVKKRSLPETAGDGSSNNVSDQPAPPLPKSQIVGWPPVRSYRKNITNRPADKSTDVDCCGTYVKVSMDGAPYLRKMDLKVYHNYPELLKAVEDMFKFKIGHYSEREGYKGSEHAPTYEDKDGDWMLVGDVPWDMFISSCKKLRIMKGSEAKGLSS